MNVVKPQGALYRPINRNFLFFVIEVALFFVYLFYYIHIDMTNVTVMDLQVLTVMNVVLNALIFTYCLCSRNIQKNVGLMCFNIVFFVLIMGQYFSALFDESIYGRYIFTKVSQISYKNEATGLLVIFISLLCVSLGYLSRRTSTRHVESHVSDSNVNDVYGRYSLIIMYLGAIAAFIKLFAKILYVVENGYLAIYLNTGEALFTNPLLDLFDGFYMIGFIGFIASFPSRDKLKIPLILYMIYSVLSLFTGQRGELVVNIIFIIWYISKRAEIKDGKNFLTRKKMVLIGILGVFFVAFLYTWGYSRVGESVSSEPLMQKINNFIYGQGGSGHLVSLSIENINSMEKHISKSSMLLWPLENFVKNNSVIRMFTGGSLGQSSTNIGSFGAALTYITNNSSYLNGSSVGTCYLAELFCSVGFFGIVIFNFLLGMFINKMDNITDSNWLINTLFMKIFLVIIYIPRQPALQFIPESAITVVFVCIMSILFNEKRRKRFGQK